ncbi:MAG: hypothetical protein HY540_06115 [Deltaproteobacteria bacterium]|nr:hypothetical protein [Deltaproteobacteria bacterium]
MPKRLLKKKPQKEKKKTTSKRIVKKKAAQKKFSKIEWEKLSVRQAAAVLREHLLTITNRAILVGSSCAAVYVPSLATKNLDFVISKFHIAEVGKLMKRLGFKARELRSFVCVKGPYEVRFPPPPPLAGDEPIESTVIVSSNQGPLELLTPTDCVRQRLAAWYRLGDEDGFQQAVAVAKKHPIDFDVVKQWSQWEWSTDKYETFVRAVDNAP